MKIASDRWVPSRTPVYSGHGHVGGWALSAATTPVHAEHTAAHGKTALPPLAALLAAAAATYTRGATGRRAAAGYNSGGTRVAVHFSDGSPPAAQGAASSTSRPGASCSRPARMSLARSIRRQLNGQSSASSRSIVAGAGGFGMEVAPAESSARLNKPNNFGGPKKPQGFDPGVLLDREGNAIGGADMPDAEGSEELLQWLAKRGCRGLHRVQLSLGGGVFLRKTAEVCQQGEAIFRIPRSAWLMAAEGEDQTSAEALAWRIMVEIWAGSDSEFAPFVQHLRKSNLKTHPIFWEETEMAWLLMSHEGYELVNEQRALTSERVERLMTRARTETAAVPQHLRDNEEALAADFRWVICLVESQAVELANEDGSESFLALPPLMGDVRNSSTKTLPTAFLADREEVVLVAGGKVKPGTELKQRAATDVSGAWYLANLGIVPGSDWPGVPTDEELLEMNTGASVLLPVPELEMQDFDPRANVAGKLRLLKEYAGLNLVYPRSPNAPTKEFCLELPADAIGKGRLLPLARFLLASNEQMEGDRDGWTKVFFNHIFEPCQLPEYPEENASLGKYLTETSMTALSWTAELESSARDLICTWCQEAIVVNGVAINNIIAETGLPVGTGGGLLVLNHGDTVLSHFKAKRADGSYGKSRKPREAQVLDLTDDIARVQFLQNNRRHEVPREWVVGVKPVPNPKLMKAGCTPERVARGKLAVTLLRTETALLSCAYQSMRESGETIDKLIKAANAAAEREDLTALNQYNNALRDFLATTEKEIDDDLEAVQPQNLKDLQRLRADQAAENEELNDKPLWNMPSIFPEDEDGDEDGGSESSSTEIVDAMVSEQVEDPSIADSQAAGPID